MSKMTAAAPLLLLVMAIAGCWREPAGTAAGRIPEEPSAVERYAGQLYVAVSALNSMELSADFAEGLRSVGEALGVKTELVGPADYDMEAVAAAIDRAVARQAAGIAVVGWEESLGGAVDRAVELGVPVVTMGLDLPASRRIAFVGASDTAAGMEAAAWVAQRLGPEAGRVALVGMPALPEVRARIEGMRRVFDERGITIVQVSDSKTDAVSAAHAARELLRRNPDLGAILAVDPHAGLGVGVAVRQAGRSGSILATGWGGDRAQLELVAEGALSGTVAPRTALMPYYATLVLWQLRNSGPSSSGDAGDAPAFIDTGSRVIDREDAVRLLQ